MNIIKTLENQMAAGNNIILENGNIVPDEKVKGEALKGYLAGIKEGRIPFNKSFLEYYSEAKKNFLTVSEVIAYIKDEDDEEYIQDVQETTADATEPEQVVEPEPEPEQVKEPEPQQEKPEPDKKTTKPTRRTRK